MFRHVIEDRFLAIRAAIGTAQEGDMVLIVGRGHIDYQEWRDENDNLIIGWFEDRKEARDALIKLPYLEQADLDRKAIPWQNAKK